MEEKTDFHVGRTEIAEELRGRAWMQALGRFVFDDHFCEFPKFCHPFSLNSVTLLRAG
jgi:hypothetical protein